MESDPFPGAGKHTDSKQNSSFFNRKFRHGIHRPQRRPASVVNSVSSAVDPEDHLGTELSTMSLDHDFSETISHYRLIDEVWHWSTVDEGRRYVSLGYNSLHSTSASRDRSSGATESGTSDLPEGKRVWSWLVLCEDKTVINIHEDPFPHSHGFLDRAEHETLFSIRRNLLNVFRNLSKAFDPSRSAAIAVLPIRRHVGDSEEERAHRPSDAPGLLFYNLFDDWFSTYSLVARREHKYAAALDGLRAEMLEKAELSHVERLHRIGRQLSVLKRLYQSYEVIIDRVLEKQETTLASLKNSHILALTDDGGPGGGSTTLDGEEGSYCASSNVHQIGEDISMLGVALSSAARARFKRLKYRTRLYAISEIDECLSQKESLVMMVSKKQTQRPCSSLTPTQANQTPTELQPHRHQGIPFGRAPHPCHPPPRQGHAPLHARLHHGRLLLVPVRGRAVHRTPVLDLVRRRRRREHRRADRLQLRVRHPGGQDAVSEHEPLVYGREQGVVGEEEVREGEEGGGWGGGWWRGEGAVGEYWRKKKSVFSCYFAFRPRFKRGGRLDGGAFAFINDQKEVDPGSRSIECCSSTTFYEQTRQRIASNHSIKV